MISDQELQDARKAQAATDAQATTGSDQSQAPDTAAASGQFTLDDFLPVLLTLLAPRKALTTVPTFTPKNFADCIQLYTDGTNFFLYVFMNGTWHTFPASPVSRIIAGDAAIGVSPGSGVGDVTIFNLGAKSVLAGTNISVSNDGNGNYTVTGTAPAAAIYKSGLVTQIGNDNTPIVVNHALGVTPKILKITATYGAATPAYAHSFGTFDGVNYAMVFTWGIVTAGGAAGSQTDRIIDIAQGGSGTFNCTASMNSTQFTLSPTVSGSPGLTLPVNILWEAYA
jgi:hypothetical protein